MSKRRLVLSVLLASGALPLAGCMGLQRQEPVQVFMVGLEPLEGQGLELRMVVKLRVQNPNDAPLAFSGASVQMDVQGKRFATGVSDVSGTVPRFGEAIVEVPVSISLFRIARQAIGLASNEGGGKLVYDLSGRLAGPRPVRFRSGGDFTMPEGLRGKDAP